MYYSFKNIQQGETNVPRNLLRGKHRKKVIPDESVAELKKHIESFSVVDSRYCRANSRIKYLERDLSLRRMYNLYIEITTNPLTFKKYSDIFKYEYNISFFKAKKDLCDWCEEFKVLIDPTGQERRIYKEHVSRKNVAKAERDRAAANLEHVKFAVLCYDLENVFALPTANVSHYFYRSKLNTYNLTGHCSSNNSVYNAIWYEYICGGGANDLAAGLIKILKAVVKENPELGHLILWSDSCVPHNMNSILFFALQSLVLNSKDAGKLQKIQHKYLERGHSLLQEIDSAIKAMLPQMPDHAKEFSLPIINRDKAKPSTKKIKDISQKDGKVVEAIIPENVVTVITENPKFKKDSPTQRRESARVAKKDNAQTVKKAKGRKKKSSK